MDRTVSELKFYNSLGFLLHTSLSRWNHRTHLCSHEWTQQEKHRKTSDPQYINKYAPANQNTHILAHFYRNLHPPDRMGTEMRKSLDAMTNLRCTDNSDLPAHLGSSDIRSKTVSPKTISITMITYTKQGFTDVDRKDDNYVPLSQVERECKEIGAHIGRVILDLTILGITVIPHA